jgi:hypothetical protein
MVARTLAAERVWLGEPLDALFFHPINGLQHIYNLT